MNYTEEQKQRIQERNEAIAAMLIDGYTQIEVAEIVGVSHATVKLICQRMQLRKKAKEQK